MTMLSSNFEQVKFKIGGVWIKGKLKVTAARIEFEFGYCPGLQAEIKLMDGSKYHGYDETNPRKTWSVKNNQRNWFQINFLRHDSRDPSTFDPYEPYEQELIPVTTERPLYPHQLYGKSFIVTRRQCILGWQMGTGKTLTSIEAQEWAVENDKSIDPGRDIWYVAPSAALQQVMADYDEWECDFRPQFMTYEHLTKVVDTWKSGQAAPKFIIYDESSRIKNPTAKRSIAARHVADSVRAEYGRKGYVLLMSGSPAPRFPADWWHQCEVACPGFLKEGTYEKFKQRLALIVIKQNEGGVGYPHLVTWLDDENKCKVCGKLEPESIHGEEAILQGSGHPWKKSVNEVSYLYQRMLGLVDVKFKKDCLNLPEKIHQVIRVKTPHTTLNAAKIISKRAKNIVSALVQLRELSDGFQYKDEVVDEKPCPNCYGQGTVVEKYNPEFPEEPFNQDWLVQNVHLEERQAICNVCKGSCVADVVTRETKQLPSPKEDALREIIENHEDVGRLVVYAGFTGSVQRVTNILLSMGWHVLSVDGRGWAGYAPEGSPGFAFERKQLYHIFRYEQEKYPKVAFVGQASAAGMGLNLTASPTIVFYSNDFNFESRIQAEDRNHRPGIEKTLAKHGLTQTTIIDIVNLDSDMLIIENHKKKKKLQNMTMGALQECLEAASAEPRAF
jgi:hypothetical protein